MWSASWNSRPVRWSTNRSTSAIRSSRGHLALNGSRRWTELGDPDRHECRRPGLPSSRHEERYAMFAAFGFEAMGVVVGDMFFVDPTPNEGQETPERGVRLELGRGAGGGP